MQELTARAALVSASDVGEGLTTSVSRDEVEEALRAEDEPLQLILDVTRYSDGEPAETRNIAVAWDRADLERLLRQADGDRVLFTFDRDAIAQAMAPDFEAHGLREKILVLAVAGTVATATASTAAAKVEAPSGGGAATAAQVGVSPDDRALARSPSEQQVGVSPDSRAVSTTEPQVGVSPDDRAVPRSTDTPQVGVSPDDRAVPRSTDQPQVGISPDDRAVPRSTPSLTPEVVASDDGTSWAPGPAETAAIAGGIALAITGAAFLIAGRRRVEPA